MGVKINPWAAGNIPATLIRRLAEAADGYRGTSDAYYVVTLKPDTDGHHTVFGPYPTPTSSLPTETLTGDWGWFGPVRTPGSPPRYTIDTIDIGTSKRSNVHLVGADFDALFYSLSAIEKFAVPYYARMYGGAYVTRLLDRARASNLHLIVHLPGTEYTEKVALFARPGAPKHFPGIAGVVTVDDDGNAVIEPIIPWSSNGSAPDSL